MASSIIDTAKLASPFVDIAKYSSFFDTAKSSRPSSIRKALSSFVDLAKRRLYANEARREES